MSSTRRVLLGLLVVAVALLGSLEFFSFVLVRLRLLPVSETPRAYASADTWKESESNWRTEQEAWGAWHKASTVGTGQKPCFRVQYRTNSIGARDSEFPLHDASPRMLLLGDSFAEGYGVNDADTAASVLEKLEGREVLNFGAGGDLGPLQYRLLYEKLASQYDHDTLLIFFLPANDFTDNDYDFWTTTEAARNAGAEGERWRPYSRRTPDGGYETFYPPAAVRRTAWSSHTDDPFTLRRFVADHLWSSNVLRSLKLVLLSRRISKAQGSTDSGTAFSGYFDVAPDRQHAALHEMEELVREARARHVVLVAVPTTGDLQRIAAGADQRATPWRKTLESLAAVVPGKDVRFVDLADDFPAGPVGLFSKCDGHWTPAGNRLAADIIHKHLPH
ncbi:MAG: SGNH/GDSL hydrolase family protein [Steroidobacteraceae bacterium]